CGVSGVKRPNVGDVGCGEATDQPDGPRTLHRQQSDGIADVLEGALAAVTAHPGDVLRPAGCVDHHHVAACFAIHHHVVHDPARVIAHHAVECPPDLETGDVVGDRPVDD